MPRPQFSDILYNRRRQLGLTITQAAKVLKLRENVLVAFEEGDFANIPKSGYAQGMLSSYARYLGLNPREVVAQFQQDLNEFESGIAASYQMPGENRSYPINYNDESMLQSPTVLGTNEGFSTTNAYERSQRYQQPSPLVNPYGQQNSLATDTSSYSSTYTRPETSYPQGRPYTSRNPRDFASRQQRYGQSPRALPTAGQTTPDVEYGDRVVSRPFDTSAYRDDLTYNDSLQPFEAAYTSSGRRNSRNIASTQRPNVSRRNEHASKRALRDRDRQRVPQKKGFVGFLQRWFSNKNRTIITIFTVLVFVLVLLVTSAVRSCVAESSEIPEHPVIATPKKPSAEEKAAQEKAAEKAAEKAESEAEDTEEAPSSKVSVEVSVGDGEVAWIEINLDGESVLAETVTGPWKKEFNVTKNISISTNKADVVKVTKNGDLQEFDKKSGGLGDLKIDGPKLEDQKSQTQQKDDKKQTGEKDTTAVSESEINTKNN